MTTFYRILALCLLSTTTALAQWTTFNTSNSPLHSNAVREVAIAADGSKWIATQRAVQRLAGSTWTTHPAANGPAFANIMCVATGSNGLVWVGSEQGLSRFDGTSWTTFNSQSQLPTGFFGPNDLTINDVVVAQNGTVWLAGSRGIAKFDGTTWTKYNSLNSALREDAVTALALDEAANTLWVGTNCNSINSGVYGFNTLTATWRYFNLAGNNCVHGVAVSTTGTVYVGTCNSSGLLSLRNGGVSAVTPSSCVSLDGVAPDPTNPQRVWVATESLSTNSSIPKGLLVYDGTAVVQQFNAANSGLPSNLLSSVVLEQAGGQLRAWVGTADQGLATYTTTITAARPTQARIALEVLPNPASSAIEIRSESTRYELTVYDNTGRLLHSQQVAQAGPVRLPVQDWAAGLYHVRLASEQGNGYARFSKE